MGCEFDELPELIQRAHLGEVGLSGSAAVSRGLGVGGLIAALLGLPSSKQICQMMVSGTHLPEQMIWRRKFDDHVMVSNFSRVDGNLVEAMGAMRLCLKPMAVNGRLQYQLIDCRLGPIRLPMWLAPRLTAWEGEADGFYEFEVDVGLPLFGRLIRYGGRLKLVA